jgi:hypothetical protein
MRLADAIAEDELRLRAQYLILRGWRHRDQEAADAWMAGQELPEGLLEKLERFPGKPPGQRPERRRRDG